MKKTISLLLSFIMIITITTIYPTTAFSRQAYGNTDMSNDEMVELEQSYNYFTNDGLRYKIISSSAVEIVGEADINSNKLKNLVIPEKVNGYKVVSIGKSAFEGNSTIESVTIPKTVTKIGYEALSYCKKLKTIKGGDSLKYISGLKENAYSKNKHNWVNGGLYYKTYLLSLKGNVKSIKLKKGTTLIAADVGRCNNNLTSVTIPNSVKYINGSAFSECENLKKVVIPDSVKILSSAFYSCPKLTDVKLTRKLQSISNGAFSDTPYFKKHLKDGICYLENYLVYFYNNKIKNYKVKEGTRIISNNVFYDKAFDNKNYPERRLTLETLFIPKSVIKIGDLDDFYSVASLKSINVDSNNKYYSSENGVLFNKALTTLIRYPASKENTYYSVPKTVKKLDKTAFYRNRNIKYLKLNDGLISIYGNALNNLVSVNRLIIPKTVKYIEWRSIGISKGHEYDHMSYNLKYGIYKNSPCEKYFQTPVDLYEYDFFLFDYSYVCSKHIYIDKKGKEPTYFAYGYTDYHQCKNCGIYKGFIQRKKLKLAVPKATVKAGKKNIKISYKKVKDATGFQVKYTKSKKSVTKTYKTSKSAAKTIKKLKKGSYNVQVRAYIQKDSKKAYSSWTKAKTVKVR